MSLQISYPHFMQFSTSQNVVRFESVDPSLNYNMISRMGGADPFPCFQGAASSDPEIPFVTPSIWDVLQVCTKSNLVASLAANDVDMMYRKGEPGAFRQDLPNAVHNVIRLQQSANIAWNSFNVREDQDATINAVLRTSRLDQNTDPWATIGSFPNLPQSLCEDLFTLGPIILNGRFIDTVHQVDWQNNLRQYSRKTVSSPKDPDYQGYHDASPIITCLTNDLDEQMYASPSNDTYGGRRISELRVYLRKRSPDAFYVPDATAEHIEFVCYGGWKAATGVSGIEPAEVTLQFHLAASVVAGVVQGTDKLFDRRLAAIPQPGVAPAIASFPTQNLSVGEMAFVTPDLAGGGVPNAYSVISGALPPGVTLNTVSGLQSGQVTSTGNFNCTIRASNALGNSDQAIDYAVT